MGRMEGPAHVIYPNYVFHGKYEHNLPIGKGVFSFDLKVVQHGYYINMKDPKFDYLDEIDAQPPAPLTDEQELEPTAEFPKGAPKGIVPIWRARYVTEYRAEDLPPEPVPVPYCQSQLSLLDIIGYLEKQYGSKAYMGGEEDEDEDGAGYNYKRLVDDVVPKQLDPAEPREV